MPTNPFSKKASNRAVINKAPLAATLPNDEATLKERAERRHDIDFDPVCLEVGNQTKTKYFKRSFVSLVLKHSHHEFLIKQLLQAAAMDIGNRIVARSTHAVCYQAIEEFIDCLNSQGQPHHKSIRYIADIDFQTTRNFVAYLLQSHPGRTLNRKVYGRLRSIVNILQRKYEKNQYVGKEIVWALAPAHNDKPAESYSDDTFNKIVEACFTDVKFIIKMMNAYTDQIRIRKEANPSPVFQVQKGGEIVGMSRDETNLLCSALVSLNFPRWPLYESFTDASYRFSLKQYQSSEPDDKNNRNLYRVLMRMRLVELIGSQSSGERQTVNMEVGQLAYFCQFFFTFQTIFPLILFVQINTGWNMEAVLNLTDDLQSHLEEDLIDPDQYVLIYSTKMRTKEVLHCRSNKVHPYSVYNILNFVQRITAKFKDSPYYCTGYLWQALLSKNLWNKLGKIVVPVDNAGLTYASRAFVKRHGINIQNNTKSPAIESKRIRTTFETKRKEQGLPIESISEMMGHEKVETTEIHYDRDSGSTNLRNKKLRQLQTGWDNDFRNYGVRLSLSTSLAQLRHAIATSPAPGAISKVAAQLGLRKNDIVHLLSPSGQTYIAACLDAKSPSWPEVARFVSPGEKCSYFNRCCMCKQAVLFKESLPYVARRVFDLDGLKKRINSFEWSNNYGAESAAWEQILDNWHPNSDVDEAKRNAMDPQYSLPLTMRGPH